MREIRFRIWNGESIEENVIDFAIDNETKHKEFYIYPDDIFMQYTGLKDKNGKEIYEGDIVKVISGKAANNYKIIGSVSMEYYCYCIVDTNMNYKTFDKMTDANCSFEVIGNIYENPELLEQS